MNERGLRAAARIREAMRDLGLVPDLVLVSPARRTMQTLEALEPWDETPLIEPLDSLYLASAPQLLQAIQSVPETVRSVLLIGHNPGMHELAMLVAGSAALARGSVGKHLAAEFPTAALAEFAVSSQWCHLNEAGGRLLHFLTPRSLEPAD